jgi:alkaline phosphatase
MKKHFLSALFTVLAIAAIAQPSRYTSSNIHAHNDYEHNVPFSDAYALQLGSIEADVFLINDSLFVSHSLKTLDRNVLLDGAYLSKLNTAVKKNNGFAYADKGRVLQLLIDLKTDSLNTLKAVINDIKKYPALLNNTSIRFVITGNQIPAEQFNLYPAYILFDGNLDKPSHLQQLQRIGLFSANFAKFSKWKGDGPIPAADLEGIKAAIGKAHAQHKQIRFWGVPDTPGTWRIMMDLGVDFINTDKIAELARFLINN